MTNGDYFRVGVVTGTHGIRGDVKVMPTTADPKRFLDLKDALLGDDEGKKPLLPVTVKGVRFFKNMVILSFKEFKDINEVEPYKGMGLFVTRENAIPLEPGEYYVKDMIGLTVVTDEGETLGTLKNVMETGANDVYVVKMEGRKDLLIPMIPECSRGVDLEKGTLTVHLLPGLLEL